MEIQFIFCTVSNVPWYYILAVVYLNSELTYTFPILNVVVAVVLTISVTSLLLKLGMSSTLLVKSPLLFSQ